VVTTHIHAEKFLCNLFSLEAKHAGSPLYRLGRERTAVSTSQVVTVARALMSALLKQQCPQLVRNHTRCGSRLWGVGAAFWCPKWPVPLSRLFGGGLESHINPLKSVRTASVWCGVDHHHVPAKCARGYPRKRPGSTPNPKSGSEIGIVKASAAKEADERKVIRAEDAAAGSVVLLQRTRPQRMPLTGNAPSGASARSGQNRNDINKNLVGLSGRAAASGPVS
jgi:hypothetical protein